MDLPSIIQFLKRVYDNPESHNLTRLEHEALREAIQKLGELLKNGSPKKLEHDSKP